MNEAPPFVPAQEDMPPGGGATRRDLVEDELDALAQGEIVDSDATEEESVVESGSDSSEESIVATYTTPDTKGTTLETMFPGLTEQLKQSHVSEDGTEATRNQPSEENKISTPPTTPRERSTATTNERPVDGMRIVPKKAGTTRMSGGGYAQEQKETGRVVGEALDIEIERVALKRLKKLPNWDKYRFTGDLTPDGFLIEKSDERGVINTPHIHPSEIIKRDEPATEGDNSAEAPTEDTSHENSTKPSAVEIPNDGTTSEESVSDQQPVQVEEVVAELSHADVSQKELETTTPAQEPARLEARETPPTQVSSVTQGVETSVPETEEQPIESKHLPVAAGAVPESTAAATPEALITHAFNPELGAARIAAREKYRELRGAMLTAKTEWEEVMQEYHNTQAQKGILGKLFDSNHYKEQIAEKQGRYLALLEQVRTERGNRMTAFMAGLVDKKGVRGEHELKQYAAFHEALLDRRIDQDIVLIERASIPTAQPESTARFLGAVKQAGRWYAGLSTKDKAKFGAAVGFAVGGGAALFTGAALVGALGVGTIAAARRVGGVLTTSTIGGAMAGYVKGKADAFAAKYVEAKLQDTKDTETFSKTKLNETLEERLKIKKTGKHIRTAGTVGAGATVVGTALVVGGSIAQGVQEALPESAQKAIETAAATETAATIPENLQNVDDGLSEQASGTVPVSPEEEISHQTTSSNDMAREDVGMGVVQEKSPDDFTDEYIPPQSTAEQTPWEPDIKSLTDQWIEQQEGVQSLGSVPDDVPAHVENINAEPVEPTPVYTVEKGDNIWKILEKKLEARGSLESLNTAQRIHIVDALKDEIGELSPRELREMGIGSGDADVVRVGDTIDLSEVLDDESVGKALSSTEGLTPDQVKDILLQRKSIMSGSPNMESLTPHPESTEPAPFTSVSSQTPPPFTSVSSLGEAAEQSSGSELRTGDFPQARSYLEGAMKADEIRALNTDSSRAVLEHVFSTHDIFSRTIEGNEKMFHANWNAISTLTMRDVFNGDGKLVLDGGRISPIVDGAGAERVVRTMITQVADGMEDHGVRNAQLLLAQAQQEDWSVGTFFERIGEELEAQKVTHDSEPTATLASLDASEHVGAQSAPLETTQNVAAELSTAEQERAVTTLEKLSRARAGEHITNPVQQRLLTERAVKVLVQHYAAEEHIDMETALERLNRMTGEYADKYLGDGDGKIEAEEGNALRDFAEKNPGFKVLRNMMEEVQGTHIPQPVATLASLDASEAVAQGGDQVPDTAESANVAPESQHEQSDELPDQLEPGYVYTRGSGVYRVDGVNVNQPNNNPWLKIPVDEYNTQHPDNPMATGGVVEETPPKGLEVHDEPKKKIERPRRTEPLFQAEIGHVTDNDKVTVGGRVGVRIGGNESIRYVDVRTNDPVLPSAEREINTDFLVHHPEWNDMTAGELLEADPEFEHAWNERVLHIRGEGSRTPLYRTQVDPRDLEQLKTMNGGDALKQLEDQLQEYHERNMRRVRFPRHHIRIKPFKD